MRWLFVARLRRFVLLAAAASLLLNLALLVPSLYMLQVFDRVFASRSVETLVMLSLFAAAALAFAYCMDTARAAAALSGCTGNCIGRSFGDCMIQGTYSPSAQASASERLQPCAVYRK